jgi:hypothetical protein
MCHVHPSFDTSSVTSSSAYVVNHQHHSINHCHHPPAHTSGAAPPTHARVATGFAGVAKKTAPPARPLQTPQYPSASPAPCPANPANPANPASCRPNGGSGSDMRMGYHALNSLRMPFYQSTCCVRVRIVRLLRRGATREATPNLIEANVIYPA